MSKNKQTHKYDSTLSRTEAASLMGILLPRLKILSKADQLKLLRSMTIVTSVSLFEKLSPFWPRN